MEKEIISYVFKRNKILNEMIQINHLAITEADSLTKQDWKHFLVTRKYLIEALIEAEDQIIVSSMIDWSSFKLDSKYKQVYRDLCEEKERKLLQILEQDKVLAQIKKIDLSEKVA